MSDRSFKEYIGSRFYDQFFNAIKSYVIQNRHNIELSSRTVSSPDYAELSDFTIKSVGIDDRDGMEVAFDVLAEAEVYVKEHHRHHDVDENTCFPWFILSCTADLSRNMDDLCIHQVEQYSQRNKQNKPLSDSLVPISYKIDLDKIATEFLRKHYPEALRTPMPVDPMVLADRLGLSVVTQELTEDFSVFGQIFFQDCDTEVFNSDTGKMEVTHFPAKTIVVDPKAFLLRNLGSVNNTIVHECVHWDQHRKAFELERLYNRDAGAVITYEEKKWKGSIFDTAATFAVLDPAYTMTVPPIQVLSGAFDTLSHAMETYLGNSDQDNVSDDVALAIMRNTVINMRRLLTDINDIQARSNLMWDSAMAENGILKVGRLTDFQVHQIEHQLGAYTDCNHGQGLAVIQPVYCRHILKDAEDKFTRFSKVVFDVDTAESGIDALESFIKECGLPAKMSQLQSKVEITPEVLRNVADTCNIIKCNPRELSRDEIYEILLECL